MPHVDRGTWEEAVEANRILRLEYEYCNALGYRYLGADTKLGRILQFARWVNFNKPLQQVIEDQISSRGATSSSALTAFPHPPYSSVLP